MAHDQSYSGVIGLLCAGDEYRNICPLYPSDAADEEDSVDLGGRRIIKKQKQKHAIK